MAPDIVRGGDAGHDKVCSKCITENKLILQSAYFSAWGVFVKYDTLSYLSMCYIRLS